MCCVALKEASRTNQMFWKRSSDHGITSDQRCFSEQASHPRRMGFDGFVLASCFASGGWMGRRFLPVRPAGDQLQHIPYFLQ
jgi:hypothetical protein